MKVDFLAALDELEKERGIGMEVLIEAIEAALAAAYKRDYNANQNVNVQIDRDTGAIHIYTLHTVVDEVEDPDTQILLADARAINPRYELGDVCESEVTNASFGRIATQTAKQVIMQRIREAERGVVYDEFMEKKDEIISAQIRRVEHNNVYVSLGRSEAYMPPSEQMRTEHYVPNDYIKVYLVEVRRTNRGPQVIVSRSHPGLVKRLFEMEVPEIQSGVVEIKSIAREAGFRTKIAVMSHDEDIDPVGACVGQRGMRVENVVDELKTEKIDIIPWSEETAEFIANSLSPARVSMVQLNEQERIARILVADNQLSLAIGREGQNARLAAKLTGWKIDIKSQSQMIAAAAEELEDEYDDEFNDDELGDY